LERLHWIDANIYFRGEQQFSFIYGSKEVARDTSGEFVLVSEPGNFYYYGINAKPIREMFPWIFKTGPGYKCKFTETSKLLGRDLRRIWNLALAKKKP
jgi:hypothetical protein